MRGLIGMAGPKDLEKVPKGGKFGFIADCIREANIAANVNATSDQPVAHLTVNSAPPVVVSSSAPQAPPHTHRCAAFRLVSGAC